MDTCIVFCAGEFDRLEEAVSSTDYLIAADGGYRHMTQLGLTPNCILGDFDSLGYIPEQSHVFPVEKDDTDTMLALKKGLEAGCRRFMIYGGLDGPRLDHTLANFQALQYLADRNARGYLVGKRYLATVIKDACVTFPAQAQGILSVFCLGSPAGDVTLTGLKYPLTHGRIEPGFPLGVSNQFLGQAASVRVAEGSLLLLWSREVGLPL